MDTNNRTQSNFAELKATQQMLNEFWKENQKKDRIIQLYRRFLSKSLPEFFAKIPGYSQEYGQKAFALIASQIEEEQEIEAIDISIEFLQRGPIGRSEPPSSPQVR